jgi:hypothetical protein
MTNMLKRFWPVIILALLITGNANAYNIVKNNAIYVPNPAKLGVISLGSMYVGNPDTDPTVVENQKTIYVKDESGTVTAVSQPLTIGAGGLPLYNGDPVTVLTDGDYSLMILNSLGSQVYYIPSDLDSTLNATYVADIATLRLSTGVTGQFVQPQGYYAYGDGAGGPLRTWASGAAPGTYVDNGGSIIVPTAGDGSAAWIGSSIYTWSVAEFGAKGDGVTDDTTAFTAATSALESVRVSAGTYNITETSNFSATEFQFAKGASVSISSTKVVTFGSIQAGLFQIFEGDGNVSCIDAYPEWWGAVGGDGIDDSSEIQSSANSAVNLIFSSNAEYSGSNIDIPDTVKEVVFKNGARLRRSATGQPIFTVDTRTLPLKFIRPHLLGHTNETSTSSDSGIRVVTASGGVTVDGGTFESLGWRTLNIIDSSDVSVTNNKFLNCDFSVFLTGCDTFNISGNLIDGKLSADDVFVIGISLVSTNGHAYGVNYNGTIIGNTVKNLEESQGIMGHAGVNVAVMGNTVTNCAGGVTFNAFNATDLIENVAITGNAIRGISGSVSYASSQDFGIQVAGNVAIPALNCSVNNNTIYSVNNKQNDDNLGGITAKGFNGLTISGNTVSSGKRNGIVFASIDGTNVTVIGNTIINVVGLGGNAGIKVDDSAIITGMFKNNWITGCARTVRVESACPLLIIETINELDNDTIGFTVGSGAVLNGTKTYTATDTTPSVKNATSLAIANSGAVSIATFDDGVTGQIINLSFADSNTTIVDGATVQLSGGANFVGTANDSLMLQYNGTLWREISRSLN